MASHDLQQQCQREWAVDEQISVAFDIARIVAVEMDEVGVERQCRIPEE
jgi:hypothetical protein